jgi:chaperone modulatory protein CbpM
VTRISSRPSTRSSGTVLAPSPGLSLDGLARQTGLHPDLLRRLVALGLIEVRPGPAGELRFEQRDVGRVCRAERLHAGLGLNYASLGLVLDLLDRVSLLEAALRRPTRPRTRSDRS